VIPAHPLALDANRKLDERRQRALTRYYLAAGAGGIAVGVHTTQFAIHDPAVGLLRPVLELAYEEAQPRGVVTVAGVCGELKQAVTEAELARSLGYDAALLSLGALQSAPEGELLEHCRAVGSVIPIFGFYLQPAVGGRILPHSFWCRFAEIPEVVAIKVAPFSRYQTLDAVRAVAESGRADEIALYTGNDDNIVVDLLTHFDFNGRRTRFAGGLLGQWAVWTQYAASMLARLKHSEMTVDLLTLAQQLTDANGAIFDSAHQFRGCVAGIHEILRRQGLLAGRWCLDPDEDLSLCQSEEIDRVCRSYPHLRTPDEQFIAENLDAWLR
jgi:dihydrodipicolinate synthase/N-acetylneuraminate lyase